MKLGPRFASPEEACCGLSSVDENALCVTTEPPEHLAYSPVFNTAYHPITSKLSKHPC